MTRVILKYSIDQLLRSRPPALTGHSAVADLWNTLKDHGIHKHTVRGTRAGQYQQRPIQPIITSRSAALLPCKQTRPCWGNLISVPLKEDTTNTVPSKNTQADSNRKGDVKICLLNPWSVCNKTTAIHDFIVDQDLDLLALTETWLKGDSRDNVIIQEILPPGYKIIQQARAGRGGGIAVIHRDSIDIKCTPLPSNSQITSFEAIECDLTMKQSAKLFVVYRPPPSTKNGLTFKTFLSDFSEFLEPHITTLKQLIVIGDFNIHVDNCDDREAHEFCGLIDNFGLVQHVQGPTHRNGHTLDLVMSRLSDTLVTSALSQDHGFPDHFPIFCELSVKRPANKTQTIQYRKLKAVDTVALTRDIQNSALTMADISTLSVSDLASMYNSELQGIMDEHAPMKTRVITLRPDTEWFTPVVRCAKQERRRAERLWRSSGLTVHREMFMERREKVNTLLKQAKASYYRSKITDCGSNTKELFKVVNTLLGKERVASLPKRPVSQLVEDFGDFFIKKVKDIKASIQSLDNATVPPISPITPQHHTTAFQPATEQEVRRIILSSQSKQCSLDPLPTKLLKACIDPLLPIITQIINASLTSGEFPQVYKSALVTPLLKKTTLDPDILKHYRPVSNLAFVSKILEKVVASRLQHHLDINQLHEPFQSAYRKGHSTETATLKVHNDIICALGDNKCVLLVMLDLSAAFDTVSHQHLLHTLRTHGITGTALEWFESYLVSRTQRININGTISESQTLESGVPQGSVLGPILFTLYTSPLGRLLRQRSTSYHMYADDSNLYLIFHPDHLSSNIAEMELTAELVRSWMASSDLKMNDDKTEVMLITPKHIAKNITCPNLVVGDHEISPSSCVSNLGMTIDSQASMIQHVNKVCKAAYMHLYNISRIKAYLDKSSLERIVHAFITSKLDYGNALLCGYPTTLLQRLQRVQNAAARTITGHNKYHHVSPVLKQLHWLPVEQRIKYKVALLVFKAKNKLGPVYLQELIIPYTPARSLRSGSQELLCVPSTNSSLVNQRAFCVAGPRLWNSLPLELRTENTLVTFKSKLKTHLFVQYYG